MSYVRWVAKGFLLVGAILAGVLIFNAAATGHEAAVGLTAIIALFIASWNFVESSFQTADFVAIDARLAKAHNDDRIQSRRLTVSLYNRGRLPGHAELVEVYYSVTALRRGIFGSNVRRLKPRGLRRCATHEITNRVKIAPFDVGEPQILVVTVPDAKWYLVKVRQLDATLPLYVIAEIGGM